MLTQYLCRTAVEEIGISVQEVFEIPVSIISPEGDLLFTSGSWTCAKDLQSPGYVRYILSLSQSSDRPLLVIPSGETIAVIPMRYQNIDCGYGLVNLSGVVGDCDVKAKALLNDISRALGDVSIYATWVVNRQKNEARIRLRKILGLFQSGLASHKDIVREVLEDILVLSMADTAQVVLADETFGKFKLEHTAGDQAYLPECLEKCGLGWWSLHSRQPVIVKNPAFDPRCRVEGAQCDIRLMGIWPLFSRDSSFGSILVLSRTAGELDDWLQDHIASAAAALSLVLDNRQKELQNLYQMRQIRALNEISRVLNSTLEVNMVLNLVSDMALNLFNASSCCVYLKDDQLQRFTLKAARGLSPEEAELMGGRFSEGEKNISLSQEVTDFPIMARDTVIGYLTLVGYGKGGLSARERELAGTFTHMAGIAIENSKMFVNTKKTLMETITALSLAIEARDKTMFGHSEQVREMAVALAEHLGLPPENIAAIESAGLLHDIGKLGIPEATLNKDGSLDAGEHEAFKKHPVVGAEILNAVTSFSSILDCVRHHHERLDGQGYPDGLKGEQIPLGARILAIADTFASLVSKRSYRAAKEPFEALDIIKANAGSQFDPELVKVFEKVVRQRYSLKIDMNQALEETASSRVCLEAGEFGLTERETEILSYMAAGLNNKEIASALYLSEKTIKTHVTNILKKLNLPDRTKAAIFAIKKGIVKIVKA